MSYILEALKKSKEERQDEGVPHLHIVHGGPVYKSRLKLSSRAGLLLLGCVVILAVGGVFFFSQQEELKQTSKQNQRIRLGRIEIRNDFFTQQEGDVVVQNSSAGSSGRPDPEVVKIVRSHAKKALPRVSVVDSPPESKETYEDIQFRRELPQDIQKTLPEYVLAGHTFADDPAQRIIIINNTILREGDSIDGDTTLLNIIWEGVVLNYKGITFKQRVH
ncbi:general secretion pathway protein GspB [Desulforhopalus sp. 52FAK]